MPLMSRLAERNVIVRASHPPISSLALPDALFVFPLRLSLDMRNVMHPLGVIFSLWADLLSDRTSSVGHT